MDTKTLLKKLADKSAFRLAWAMLWRMWGLVMGFYIVVLVVGFVLLGLASLIN